MPPLIGPPGARPPVGPRLIYRPDALESGWLDTEIARQRLTGRWSSVRPGAYVDLTAGAEMSDRDRHLALIASTMRVVPHDAVVSHASAALLFGITIWPAPKIVVQVTRPRGSGGHRRRLLHTRMAALKDDEVVEVGPYRVTSPARTLIDMGRSGSLITAVVAMDDAMHHGLTDREALSAAASAASRRPGAAQARRAVLLSDPLAESVGESRSRVLMRDHGVPAPASQYPFFDDYGKQIARVDFAWEEARTIGEFDGMDKYHRFRRPGEDAGAVVQREKIREDGLRERGWNVVRWIWADLDAPAELAARILRALERGRRLSR